MDHTSQIVFFVGQAGRLRRACGAARRQPVLAGTAVKLDETGGDCAGFMYVCVQVAQGSPAPLRARFGTKSTGMQSAQHNYVADGSLFEQVISKNEELWVECELATTLLVQMVSFEGLV